MAYKHGIYGGLVPSSEVITTGDSVPVYIGTAPVHMMNDSTGSINVPLLIQSESDGSQKLGYSPNDDFDKFTLSAAIHAHFSNRIQAIGPIVVINVLDPNIHKKAATNSINLSNGKGTIDDDLVVLKSVSIADKVLGTHYTAEYDSNGKVIIASIESGLSSPVQVSYDKLDFSTVTDEVIVGKYDSEKEQRTGIKCLDLVYEELNLVPSIISAPGFNHKPTVEKALVSSCTRIGGRWETICVTDIDPREADTIAKAKAWKVSNGYTSKREKVCWPKGKIGDKSIWMSILTIVRMLQTDYTNDGVPYESPSNKQLDITGITVSDNKPLKFNIVQGNELNEIGITTAIYNGGKWVLWGPHMANYQYGTNTASEDIKAEDIFDVNIRTNLYLLNDFQLRYASLIDSPIDRNDIDSILNNEQIKLNSLIAEGKLLYGGISFNSKSNVTSDLIQGDFTFDTAVTNTPPGKSLTNRIQYTSQGISALVGGEN